MSAWQRHLRPTLDALDVYDVPPVAARARLHANECPEPWPADVMDALADVVRRLELHRYPDTSGRALRAVLAGRHGCTPDRIVLGNGSDEVISLLLTALSGPLHGTPVLVVPAPTFVMYGHTARVLGYEVRDVALDANLEIVEPAMRTALAGASICFIARPNNPTGGLPSAAVIERLVAEFPDVVFVIDEAYGAYAPGTSLWDPDGPDNRVHMGTLSKIGLAALRVGYCIAHPVLARALDKVRHPYNLSATSLALAVAALERFGEVQQAMIERKIEGRATLSAILAGIPGARVFPSWGNLVLVRLPGERDAPDLCAHLAAREILVKDVSSIPGLSRCLRVGVGTHEELALLRDALATWRARSSTSA